MLSFLLTDINGEHPDLGEELNFVLNAEEDVPADDISVIFPYKKINELKEITVFDDGAQIFSGLVDEQQLIDAPSGRYIRIAARSMAALLLDNEATPVTYNHPTSGLIAERYVRSLGLLCDSDPESTYFGELVITKGMSEWQVVEQFCSLCYASRPRIGADGKMILNPSERSDTVVFGDSGSAIRYTELRECVKRCEEVSRVNVRSLSGAGYISPVNNEDALSRGIRRERYLNAAVTGTPMKVADSIIANGRRAGYRLELRVPQRLSGVLGYNAEVRSEMTGALTGLYVSALRYTLSSEGEYTELTLRRRES